MTTELIRVRKLSESAEDFSRAGNLLRCGNIVAIPTETVYGLAANAFDADAIKKVFEAKGRPQDNPLIVHISDIEDIAKLTVEFPEAATKLAEKFWPGPLTMILKKSDKVPLEVTAGLSTVAVRFPSHSVALAVITAAGVPLAAPSANLSGKPSPTTAQHVMRDLSGKIPMIIDGGACEVGLESTVIDLSGDVPTLLRPGGVTLTELRKVLGRVDVNPKILEEVDDGEAVASPGMKYKHYSPSAPVVIVDGKSEEFASFVKNRASDKKVAVLCFDEESALFDETDITVVSYGSLAHPEELAAKLFSALRTLDDISPDVIYAREPSCGDGLELAVVNRLSRAAGFSRISL